MRLAFYLAFLLIIGFILLEQQRQGSRTTNVAETLGNSAGRLFSTLQGR